MYILALALDHLGRVCQLSWIVLQAVEVVIAPNTIWMFVKYRRIWRLLVAVKARIRFFLRYLLSVYDTLRSVVLVQLIL